ncbi:16S rRNA (uracil(1498)-N(3))-methyltransferase [Caloranaerobacter azorensis]|uniref:Ribosomal RNA small subunit methyltransferase E n=1 Tax=Caloranaerobacter azorensis TaxID=116090 RepID=A0A6P1YBV9_9FIRM|nr:16S rRNA (uracil(1498)-N(3))-methyltransferase [Caloranaerobacter azorensis]QIB26328.1 16S rRNA (uracil(1498)-N(3))-methyltransferase [Caloranaerobacter azorensis]
MHKFFVDKKDIIEDKITIKGEDVKHIKNVLRLNIGEIINVSNCEGKEYFAEIINIEKNYVEAIIKEEFESRSEPPIQIVLYQGLPKSSKMDLIIQKATELGVVEIVPLITKRTVVRIEDEKKELKKLERWRRIVKEASKQCRRGIIPVVSNIVTFNEMIDRLKDEEFILVPYENEMKMGLKDILKSLKKDRINIIIGPEGGFEKEEIERLKEINAHIVSLGPRILRTETAGFTAIAVVMYELGDLGVI